MKDEGLNASIPTAVVDAKFLGHFLTKQEASEALSLRSDRATAVYIYANTSINVVYRILTYTDPVFSTTETFFWVGPLRDAHQIEDALTDAGRLLPDPTGTAQDGLRSNGYDRGRRLRACRERRWYRSIRPRRRLPSMRAASPATSARPTRTYQTLGNTGCTDFTLGGGGTDDQTAAEVTVDATAFAGNLSADRYRRSDRS